MADDGGFGGFDLLLLIHGWLMADFKIDDKGQINKIISGNQSKQQAQLTSTTDVYGEIYGRRTHIPLQLEACI